MAVVEDKTNSHDQIEDKTHSHDQISTTTSIPMNNTRERDLFNKFMAAENQRRRCHVPLPTVKSVHQQQQRYAVADELMDDDEDLELSLGLSMNGRFGFDPNAKKIKRTTSIPEFMMPVTGGGSGDAGGGSSGGGGGDCGNLIRTCSLPAESEEEWRKRKEMQSQRRMEARRKRNEKQRNLRAMRERNNFGGGEGGVGNESGGGNSNNLGDGLIRTTSLASRVSGLGLYGGEKEKDQVLPPSSPPQGGGGGSGGSIGGSIGSSGTSESEGQQHGQGTTPMDTDNSGKIAGAQSKTKDFRNLFEDMPSVSTKVEGPNGKRIEGFLYKYGKGEEVRILCVCHGSFLTPAEFVKHGGGGDVTNPLKHIVVNSSFN